MDYYTMIGENQIQKYNGEALKKFAGNRMIKYVANPTDADMVEFGFKPLQASDMPERDGYYYTAVYTEQNDKIVQSWQEHEVVEEDVINEGIVGEQENA